jgi:ATP-binding protein involved in chromosome partitioning
MNNSFNAINFENLKNNIKKFIQSEYQDINKNIENINVSFIQKNKLLLIEFNLFENFADSKQISLFELNLDKILKDFFDINDFYDLYNFSEYKIIITKKKNNSSEQVKLNKSDNALKNKNTLKNIKNIIMVGSGKGGVGKSTISSNLALSIASMGWRVGLVDADIYGASIPIIFAIDDIMIKSNNEKKMIPINLNQINGYDEIDLKINSIGFITKFDEAVVWRGPMISKALDQIILQTEWGEIDYLIIDTPPGTGDIHINLLQKYNIDLMCLVSTESKSSLSNTQKTSSMIKKIYQNNDHYDQIKIFTIFNMIEPKSFSNFHDINQGCNEYYKNNIEYDFDFIKISDVIFQIPRISNVNKNPLCINSEKYINLISREIIKNFEVFE